MMNEITQRIRSFIRGVSIRNEITIALSAIIAVISVFIYIYFPNLFREQAIEEAQKRASTITNLAIYTMAPSLVFNDSKTLNEAMEKIVATGDVYYIVVKNKQDSIVCSHFLNRAIEVNYSAFLGKYNVNFSNRLIQVNAPILVEGENWGKVYLGYSINDLVLKYQEFKASILGVSLAMFLLGIVVSFVLSFLVTKPILRLTKTIEKFGKGDFSARVREEYPREMMPQVNSFNELFERLEKAYIELSEEIEARKRSEMALLKAKEELGEALKKEKELNELRSRFISMVSHEYRTPLSVILSSTYLLEIFYKQQNEENFKRQIDLIQASVQDMTNLLDDVLTIGRFEANKVQVEYRECDIVSLLFDLILQFEMTDKAQHKISFNKDVDKLIIKTDARLIKQIMNNLLSNALKYSPPNSNIDVGFENYPDYYTITIKDSGIGIAPEELKHLFEPFFRSPKVASISGTGLGLSIVKRSVEALGGTISVESEVNKGTTFIVKLPKNHIC